MNTFRFSPTESGFSQQRLGNYQLIQLLGSGGFARVYLGKHTYLNTLAAVKVLDASQEDVDVEKFLVEARIAASLQHPHIIRVLECGLESEWLPYLIMDYAPNGTLHQLHSDGSQLSPNLIIRYVRQIASALRFIHERGFIHRDIKPANVLLGYDHRLLLADFGIAMATHEAAATDEELCFGTVLYTAPEQIMGSPCQASDQYALGIASQLLWFLLVLCILLTPVGWAMTRKNYQIFFPTVTIVIVAGFTAIAFQNLILFVVTYLTLLLFSLLMSLSAIIHGY